MRDYLYIWHKPEQQFVVASGIEFKDFLPLLREHEGVVLIEQKSETAGYDANSSLNFVQASNLSELAAEDIYSWGNFVWADYAGSVFPSISDEEVAELLFFAHKAKPLHRIVIKSFITRIQYPVDTWKSLLWIIPVFFNCHKIEFLLTHLTLTEKRADYLKYPSFFSYAIF